MSILSIREVVKRYHNHLAVDHLSFDMQKGSIMGLLGPNGAGKTSLIRIITGITQADAGVVIFDGTDLDRSHPEQIGYLPEERGLYKKMKVGDQLMYLARLKGMPQQKAKREIETWMDKLEMSSWWNKRIEELSKGMQQKVQFLSTVVHKPKLIILDEPFSGLDPINTDLLKQHIKTLNEEGSSIIFSTHRMEQVEEICEYIVLINKGKNILNGNVTEIKEQYKDHIFEVFYQGNLPEHLSVNVEILHHENNLLLVRLNELSEANTFIRKVIDHGVMVQRFEEILPTLNDIFIRKVTEA